LFIKSPFTWLIAITMRDYSSASGKAIGTSNFPVEIYGTRFGIVRYFQLIKLLHVCRAALINNTGANRI
jgi:hypothetical protein